MLLWGRAEEASMRGGLRVRLALCGALGLAALQSLGANAASAPVAVDAAIVLAADVSRSIDDE
jgi:hypothetical protein